MPFLLLIPLIIAATESPGDDFGLFSGWGDRDDPNRVPGPGQAVPDLVKLAAYSLAVYGAIKYGPRLVKSLKGSIA